MKTKSIRNSSICFTLCLFLILCGPAAVSLTHGEDVTSLIARGDEAFQKNRYEEAVSFYNEALKLDPDNYAVLLNLGFSLSELGQYDRSLECYKKAKEAGAPFNGSTVSNSVESSKWYTEGFCSHEVEYRIECYKKAYEIEPSCAFYCYAIGVAFGEGKHDIKTAETYLKRTMKFYPLFNSSYSELGFLLYQISLYPKKAIHYLSVGLVVNPDSKFSEDDRRMIEELKRK